MRYIDWSAAAAAGALLAIMIDINSGLAQNSTPLLASWVVHGVGAVAAFLLLHINIRLAGDRRTGGVRPPRWSYLGGLPGAAAVALSAIAVNSPLALSGALSLLLVGQILFGLVSDQWGLFGAPIRKIGLYDAMAAALVAAGSMLVIFSGGPH